MEVEASLEFLMSKFLEEYQGLASEETVDVSAFPNLLARMESSKMELEAHLLSIRDQLGDISKKEANQLTSLFEAQCQKALEALKEVRFTAENKRKILKGMSKINQDLLVRYQLAKQEKEQVSGSAKSEGGFLDSEALKKEVKLQPCTHSKRIHRSYIFQLSKVELEACKKEIDKVFRGQIELVRKSADLTTASRIEWEFQTQVREMEKKIQEAKVRVRELKSKHAATPQGILARRTRGKASKVGQENGLDVFKLPVRKSHEVKERSSGSCK